MFGPQALPGVLAVPSPVGATPGGHHSSQARCAIALGFTVSELSAGRVGGACFCLTLTPPRRWGGWEHPLGRLGSCHHAGSCTVTTRSGHEKCRCGSKARPLPVASRDKRPAKWQSHRRLRPWKPSGFRQQADRGQEDAEDGSEPRGPGRVDRAAGAGGGGARGAEVTSGFLRTGPGSGGQPGTPVSVASGGPGCRRLGAWGRLAARRPGAPGPRWPSRSLENPRR